MASEIIVISPELKKLIDNVPVELIRPGPERYEAMNPEAKGSRRIVYYGDIPTAIVWTDWQNSFDVYNLQKTEVTDRLANYVISAKALDIPAGWAYSSLTRVVPSYELGEPVELSAQVDGKLGDIVRREGDPGEQEEEDVVR